MGMPSLIATSTGGAASGTTVTVNVPTGTNAGDLMVALVRGQGTATGTTQVSASGWTAAHTQGSGDRVHMILWRLATGSEPASYTFNTNGSSARIVAAIETWRDVDNASPIAGSHAYAVVSGTSQTLTSFTIDSSTDSVMVINLFSDEKTSGQSYVPTGIPSGYTTGVNVQNTLDSSSSTSRTVIWSGYLGTTGTTTVADATLTVAAATQPRASAIAIRGSSSSSRTATGTLALSGTADGSLASAPVTATGFVTASGSTLSGAITTAAGSVTLSGTAFTGTTRVAVGTATLSGTAQRSKVGFASVADFLATPGATSAWRLGGGPYPQHSEYAGDRSVELGYGALEFSCGWTSDLVPFGLGVQYLDSIAGVSGNVDPTTMTWATLSSTYVNKNNPVATNVFQPFFKLEDALKKWSKTHVFLVDPKYGFDTGAKIDAMLDICDANGGPTKILIKFDSPTGATTLVTRAHARGYTCINYWGTDTTSLASQQSNWDVLGMAYTATSGQWTTAKSYGKPVWAAIVPDQAGYNTAWTNSGGFNFANVSGVTSVAPVSAASTNVGGLTLSGTAVVSSAIVATASGSLTAQGTASGVEREFATAQGSLVESGSSVYAASTTAAGALGAQGQVIAIQSQARTAAATMTLTGTADVGGGVVTRTATAALLLGGVALQTVKELRTAPGALSVSGTAIGTTREVRTGSSTLLLAGSTQTVQREIRMVTRGLTAAGIALGVMAGATARAYLGDRPVNLFIGDRAVTLG